MASMSREEKEGKFHSDEILGYIVEALSPAKLKWYQIGVQLSIPLARLKEIELKHGQNFDRALIEILERWLQSKTMLQRLSKQDLWAEIVNTLKRDSVDENFLAEKIQQKYVNLQDSLSKDPRRSLSEPHVLSSGKQDSARMPEFGGIDHRQKIGDTNSFSGGHIKVSAESTFKIVTETSEAFSGTYEYLDLDNLSPDEKLLFEGRLTKEYQTLTSKYSALYQQVHTSLTSRGVTPKQLALVLMHLSAFAVKERDSALPLLEDCLGDIEEAEDIQEVFKLIRSYESFLDCHVIQHIVSSHLCTVEDKQKMKEYQDKLDEYCRRNVYECPHIASLRPNSLNLVMKVDDIITKRFTLKAVGALCAKIAIALNLNPHTLRICSVKNGCLQVTCQIPRFIKDHIFPLSHQQKDRLQNLNIRKIMCDDDVVFAAPKPMAESESQLSLESDNVETIQSEQGNIAGRLGIGRCAYIHQDGITQRQDFFEFEATTGTKSHTIKVKLPASRESYRQKGQLCRIDDYSSLEKLGATKGPGRQESLYDMRENQERALSRPLRTYLIQMYIKDIEDKLVESLRLMHKHGLTPKLEGRFGELCWRKVSGEVQSRKMFMPEEFSMKAFESTSSYFYTRIGRESKEALSTSLKDDLIDEIETYDFKLKTANGRLDIRVKFSDTGKPEVVAVKRAEYKFAIFDVLCLNRCYDMRISLNNYEATSTDNPVVEAFISTLVMLRPRVVSFSLNASDDSWTLDLVRHKEIKTYMYQPPQFVVSVSTVRQFEVDRETNTTATVVIDSKGSHTEIELHNLAWEVSFGHMLGCTPEKSLVLFMKPEKISTMIKEVTGSAPKKWTPEWVMEDFTKGGFVKMMESLNKVMDI